MDKPSNVITLTREELVDHGLPCDGYDGVEVIERMLVDSSRWSLTYTLTFRWTDGKVYRTFYSEGATEIQDESPWEYEKEIECVEVRQVEKTVLVWEAVEKD